MPLFDKPFALSIGPQRSGSSFLHPYFKARGDVCLPRRVDEVFFFDRHFQRGPAFYTDHFRPEDVHNLIMEMTTTIFDSVDAPTQVSEAFRDTPPLLFCTLRHPVTRAFAVYQDLLRYGIVNGGISKAVEQAPQILYASRYALHLERWFEVFGQENIKIVSYDDLYSKPAEAVDSLCDFLNLPYMPIPEHIEAVSDLTIKDAEILSWLNERLQSDIDFYKALTA